MWKTWVVSCYHEYQRVLDLYLNLFLWTHQTRLDQTKPKQHHHRHHRRRYFFTHFLLYLAKLQQMFKLFMHIFFHSTKLPVCICNVDSGVVSPWIQSEEEKKGKRKSRQEYRESRLSYATVKVKLRKRLWGKLWSSIIYHTWESPVCALFLKQKIG